MSAATETYLGDAVHAGYDGYMVCLRTSDDNHQRIYLEPTVLNALVKFIATLKDNPSA